MIRETKLTRARELELIELISNTIPQDHGYDQNIFTAKVLQEIVKARWDVNICDETVYSIFGRHGWSYQRAHRDYENADPEKQREFAEQLKVQVEQLSEGEELFFR